MSRMVALIRGRPSGGISFLADLAFCFETGPNAGPQATAGADLPGMPVELDQTPVPLFFKALNRVHANDGSSVYAHEVFLWQGCFPVPHPARAKPRARVGKQKFSVVSGGNHRLYAGELHKLAAFAHGDADHIWPLQGGACTWERYAAAKFLHRFSETSLSNGFE